jgi:hypothetical protein
LLLLLQARMVVVVPQGVHLPPRHLYLLERLEDKVAAINARIAAWKDWTAAALRASATAASSDGSGTAAAAAAAGLQHIDWHPVGAPAQEDCFFAGRIVCEVEGGALNDTAVMLEGDSELSEGARVHLDLSQLPAYRLFPGQVRRRAVVGVVLEPCYPCAHAKPHAFSTAKASMHA